MNELAPSLKNNVGLLGQLLGETIQAHLGEAFLDKVETIRQLSKSSREGNREDKQKLIDTLENLTDDELLPVCRAFSQFLNLANIAEQHYAISRQCEETFCLPDPLDQAFSRLKAAKKTTEEMKKAVDELSIELVLTAHPTEVTRRTLIHKHVLINECLSQLEHRDLASREKQHLIQRLAALISQAWHTNEIRKQRPTPIDEAKSGFAVIENSLWQAVPDYLRRFDQKLQDQLEVHLDIEAAPIQFSSWMGGDRDGNPFVTAKVTEETLLLARWSAADLYQRDLRPLIFELSMQVCSDEFQALAGDTTEPYRQVLKQLRKKLLQTKRWLEAKIAGEALPDIEIIETQAQLWEPLKAVYDSLHQSGMGIIADGALLDMLRQVRCFGAHLVRLDIRQESGRHAETLSELTRYLGLGDYGQWTEEQKQTFLIQELVSKRPLIPHHWQPSAPVQEVLDTCKTIAQQDPNAFGAYVISMAKQPSDVLAVKLLLQECGCTFSMPVAPLFETLDDLDRAESVMNQLFNLSWYRGEIDQRQQVMIGYSDSAKDAGMIAAGWAQYRAQEALCRLAEQHGICLTLFHGRGGTIGRGGAPAHAALLSQPPGSLKGGLRVTEQGEMIRFKFGLPEVAEQSLGLYTGAILEANLLPPPEPQAEWRSMMDQLAEHSCEEYRNVVREEPDFVPYFRAATPELELGKLPLGSRPAKRNPQGGVESLRAIPWIFAWTQNRLMLPAWLGSAQSLNRAIQEDQLKLLKEMSQQWPFFRARIGMLEMVFKKADFDLTEYYDQRLVPEHLWHFGLNLREKLHQSVEAVLQISNGDRLMAHEPWIEASIDLRNPYTDPLNILQAELLRRTRQSEHANPALEQALMVTIAGVAAGMRNTG